MTLLRWALVCVLILGLTVVGLGLYYGQVVGDAELGNRMLWVGAILLIVLVAIGGFFLARVKV